MTTFPTVIRSSWNQECSFVSGTVWPADCVPPPPAVLVVAFHDGDLVLADIRGRGATVPSGHIEPGETPVQAAERETYEETGGRIEPGSLRQIGFHTYKALAGPDEGVKHACPVYISDIANFDPLPDASESDRVILAKTSEISHRYFIWDELVSALFEHAFHERAVSL